LAGSGASIESLLDCLLKSQPRLRDNVKWRQSRQLSDVFDALRVCFQPSTAWERGRDFLGFRSREKFLDLIDCLSKCRLNTEAFEGPYPISEGPHKAAKLTPQHKHRNDCGYWPRERLDVRRKEGQPVQGVFFSLEGDGRGLAYLPPPCKLVQI